MKARNRLSIIILLLIAIIGLWQFSNGVRNVDVLGLFASGALAGAVITGFFPSRK